VNLRAAAQRREGATATWKESDAMKSRWPAAAAVLLLGASVVPAQRLEVTPLIGVQWNGSVDYTARNYTKADIGNALTYGFAAGVYVSTTVSLEFMWNRSTPDLAGTPLSGGAPVKLFQLNTNQYFGNVLFHFGGQEDRTRPYILVGMGATHFSPEGPGSTSLTRPTFGIGGGVKQALARNADLRLQWRWLPTNMYTSQSDTWCGPVTGCWSMGSAHYLHSLELTAGVGFRF
jgi:opacity protein-like surface antigen